MLGSAIFVSAFAVEIRRRAFLKSFRSVVLGQQGTAHPGSSSRKRSFSEKPAPSPAGPAPAGVESSNHKKAGDTSVDVEESANFALQPKSTSDKPLDMPMEPPISQDSRRLDDGLTLREHLIGRTASGTYVEEDAIASDTTSDTKNPVAPSQSANISFDPHTRFRTSFSDNRDTVRGRRRSVISLQGVGASSGHSLGPLLSRVTIPMTKAPSNSSRTPTTRYFASKEGYIARNSQFHNLSAHEREQLGGVEYRAIQWLSWIVPAYFILWQLLGCLALAAYVAHYYPDTTAVNALNPWWVGAFNAVSAFNNSGMSLLDANMTVYQTAYYMLITMSLLILAGNTCFPIFLRLIIWTIHRYMPKTDAYVMHRTTLTFLLEHPRRCYTNLFPAKHTWWLLLAVVVLNGIDWIGFEILNIGNQMLTLATNVRVIDGLFQAFAVRSGGFYIVPIPTLRISLQVLYVIMMYISVYPVTITMRNSNVYEERSLGIYADDDSSEHTDVASLGPRDGKPTIWGRISRTRRQLTGGGSDTASYFVRQQVRAQLAHDIWWVVLAIFFVMIVEGSQFQANPAVFSVFNVIFEVVSAYGTVGISVGLPDQAYSFCGAWHTTSKLILCVVMLRGRHRGLPVAIDKAVTLPGQNAALAEEEDAVIRLERSFSRRRSDYELA